MRINRRTLVLALLLLAALLQSEALAQDSWPARPVTLVVGAPPGGSLDTLARLISVPLASALGKPVVVLNRPGGGQVVATAAVAAASDGHSFLLATEGLALNGRLHPEQPDPRLGLTPVMLMTRSSLSIAAAPQAGYKSFADLVADARRRPGEISYGSSGGTATLSNLLMVALQSTLEVKLLHVPFASGPQAVQSSLAGQTALAVGTSFLIRPQASAGKLQALAVTSATREPSMQDVPSLAELGLAEQTSYAWWGLLAPRSTPPAVLARMHEELANLLALREIRERLVPQGMEIVASSPQAFAQFLDAEVARWGEVIDKNKVRAGE